MKNRVKNLAPLHFIAVIPTDSISTSGLIIDNKDKEARVRDYLVSGMPLEVVQVAPDCSFVKVGDAILIADRRPVQMVTLPNTTETFAVIRESDVLVII